MSNENYDDKHKTPVLTAGKSFILGHTNEDKGIYEKLPVIIFDDFTTANKYVNFPFKVKSSAMKLLTPKNENVNLKFVFYAMQNIKIDSTTHKRYYLSRYQKIKILLPPIAEQKRIVNKIEKLMKLWEQLKTQSEENKTYSEKLMGSVLSGIFKG